MGVGHWGLGALVMTLAVTAAGARAGAMAGAAAPAGQAQARQIGGVGITVFEDSEFRGRNATFRQAMPRLNESGLDGRISSLQVAPGEMWEGCERENFRGRCQVFSGTENDLRRVDWNDEIRSLRPVRGGGGRPPIYPPEPPYPPYPPVGRGGIELFSDTNFRGDRRVVDTAVTTLRQVNFNDKARSARVISGAWELCVDDDFMGGCVRVDRDISNLSQVGMSRRASSIRPTNSGIVPPRPWPGQRPRLVLFDNTGYRGQSWTIERQESVVPGSGRAESAQVFGTWEVCAGPNGQSPCVTLSRNVSDLRSLGFRNRIVSARPLDVAVPR